MAILLPQGKQQYFTSAGVPLVGGRVETYDAGTTNPRATFQDAAGAVPNTNPVILDARGEATIFWAGAYKVILKDALGAVIWTQDNISGLSGTYSTLDNYSIDSGVANAYVVAAATPLSAYVAGLQVAVKVINTNTGPSTLNYMGLGVKPIIVDGRALSGGEIQAGGVYKFIYDGANFQLLNATNSANVRTAAEIAAGITPTYYDVPSHVGLGYALASRYGFRSTANGGTGAINRVALAAAHAVAVAAVCAMATPTGLFPYTPTVGPLVLTVDWANQGMTTLLVDMTAYAGVVVQQSNSSLMRNIYLQRTGTVQGTGIQQFAAVTTDFTAYQTHERVWSIGFGRCLEIGNVFMNSYRNGRYNDAIGILGVGIYCNPPTNGGDNGYFTTLQFDSCEIRGNAQNLNIIPTVQSHGMKFTNCSIEVPTTTPAAWVRVRELHFDNIYVEGTSGFKALNLADCTATMNVAYFNGSGGVLLGTGTEFNAKGVRTAGAPNLNTLTGGDGTQTVTMEDCTWPTAGNVISFLHLTMRNMTINNVFYEDYYGPRGTAPLTGTGFSGAAPTGNLSYTMGNDEVIATIPIITGVSNAVSFTLTGIPAALRPATAQFLPATFVQNNGANIGAICQVTVAGEFVFYTYPGLNANGFTAAGNKGVILPIAVRWKLAA